MAESGYPYGFDDAETLNYKEYNCPNCKSLDRDRLYALFLEKELGKDKNYDLLDFAPAPGLRKRLKEYPNVRYRCADLFKEDVDDKVDIMNMNIYPDNSFDVFICSHILEHVEDDKKAMRELYRVLRPGGFGIAMVPIVLHLQTMDEDISITDPLERWRRFGQDDHVRLYSRSEFIKRLSATGFHVQQVSSKDFDANDLALYGISPTSVLYIVRK